MSHSDLQGTVTSQTQFRAAEPIFVNSAAHPVAFSVKCRLHKAVRKISKEAQSLEEGGGVEMSSQLHPLKPVATSRTVND